LERGLILVIATRGAAEKTEGRAIAICGEIWF
jgi:hypothetical protein